MADGSNDKKNADPPRLFLMTPRLTEAAAFLPQLAAAIDGAVPACVLVSLAVRDEGSRKKLIRTLAPIVQSRDIALLVADDATLAARADADGVHISGQSQPLLEALEAALDSLRPERIVGAAGIRSKHDAMTAGELDVDYVMFGDSAANRAAGSPPPLTVDEIVQRVAWWAEIFNLPCVGYAHGLAQVGPLAAAGADFIALQDAVWKDPRGPGAAMAEAFAAAKMPAGIGVP